MTIAYGITWNDSKRGHLTKIAAAVLAAALLAPGFAPAIARASETLVSVIVRAVPGAGAAAETEVVERGGIVTRRIGIIDGVVAHIPASQVSPLMSLPVIHSITHNRPVRLSHSVDRFDAAADPGSTHNAAKTVRTGEFWRNGHHGAGVDVALIDSGVVPVNGLTTPGKIINGPDLSFESQSPSHRYLDTYGHGTHMAGIIAGRDDDVASSDYASHDTFNGIAPASRILNVKVANAMGATDVSQVLAAIDWVVQHRNDNGMNVRVMNLSFGTDSAQDYVLDPLSYAAEVAWRKGIVVVVAAGNYGSSLGRLNDPAYNPYVLAVGADDSKGTPDTVDDSIPDWSSRGSSTRGPDVVAPGKSIVSLRAVNSQIDATHPEGRVNNRFFRGSGTSQAAAVVSGAAALLLSQRPNLTPDQVKRLLTTTATSVPNASTSAQGSGLINLRAAASAPTPSYTQNHPTSTGTGSLDAARGSAHLEMDGVVLTGEQDIFGNAWSGTSWSGTSWSGTSWSGTSWSGTSWSGTSWSGTSWSGTSWSGTSWSGTSWSGTSWSGTSWSGTSWSGTSWSGTSWSGTSWSGNSWSGTSWSGSTWSSASWGSDYDPSVIVV